MYDSAAVDYDTGAGGLDDLIFRGGNPAADACDAMKIGDMIFRCPNLPPDEFSARRNGDYIWHDLGTELSVFNLPVTGSHGFGSSHRLERCCLWRAASLFEGVATVVCILSQYWIEILVAAV